MMSAKDEMIERQAGDRFAMVAKELGGDPAGLEEAGMQIRQDRMNDGTLQGYLVEFDDEQHPEVKRVQAKHGRNIELSASFFDIDR